MGLSTTSYAHLEAMPEGFTPPLDEYGEPSEEFTRACTYADFPDAMDGIPGGHEPDPPAPSVFIGSRWYRLTKPGPRTSRSYAGHGAYRDALVAAFWSGAARERHVSSDDVRGEPFRDLIWFADNEGMLGAVACSRLVEAFGRHPRLPEEFAGWQDYHDAWARTVRHAANGGAVLFRVNGQPERALDLVLRDRDGDLWAVSDSGPKYGEVMLCRVGIGMHAKGYVRWWSLLERSDGPLTPVLDADGLPVVRTVGDLTNAHLGRRIKYEGGGYGRAGTYQGTTAYYPDRDRCNMHVGGGFEAGVPIDTPCEVLR